MVAMPGKSRPVPATPKVDVGSSSLTSVPSNGAPLRRKTFASATAAKVSVDSDGGDLPHTLAEDIDHALQDNLPFALPYVRIAELSTFELSQIARGKLPNHLITLLAADLKLDRSMLTKSLGLSSNVPYTARNRGRRLNVGDSERVLGCAAILGELERIVFNHDGERNFDAGQWLGAWLLRPLPALGFRVPISLLDTIAGQRVITDLLRLIESGSYA